MLETLLFTPTTTHSSFPFSRAVHAGFPTVVCPKLIKPVHEDPVNPSTHKALFVTPKTPQTSWLGALTRATAFRAHQTAQTSPSSPRGYRPAFAGEPIYLQANVCSPGNADDLS